MTLNNNNTLININNVLDTKIRNERITLPNTRSLVRILVRNTIYYTTVSLPPVRSTNASQ